MAHLPETEEWDVGVYQIETSDPVLGGPDGVTNRPIKALANRSAWLKAKMASVRGDLSAHVNAADPHTQYAPKVDPIFTGTPRVPTADAGTRTEQAASTAFVHTVVAALVNSAPAALDTLSELAAALGNDASFAATIANALAGKADKSSLGSYPRVHSISALPGQNVGPIVVAECSEVWVWVTSQYFTGYRSPLCGRPVDGHTVAPLASEVDAVGGTLSKSAYARLWGYAQENGLVVSQDIWAANLGAHYFVSVDASYFRAPDLRNMFRRYTGTDADTANARAMGSRQRDAIRNMTGSAGALYRAGETIASGVLTVGSWGNTPAKVGTQGADPGDNGTVAFDASKQVPTSTENRPVNTAYHPRIHA